MLNIYFGDMPSAIYNTEIYFKNTQNCELQLAVKNVLTTKRIPTMERLSMPQVRWIAQTAF